MYRPFDSYAFESRPRSGELLMYRPSSYPSSVVPGQTRDGCIVVDIVNAGDDPEPFRREFDGWYANMEKWLEAANNQANRFNGLLPGRIKDSIDASVKAIRSGDDIKSALEYEETPTVGGLDTERTAATSESGGVDLTIPEREGTHNEFKETFTVPVDGGSVDMVRMAVARTVAAFTNTEGGRLFIGVDDCGKVAGLKRDLKKYHGSTDKLELAIRNFVDSKLSRVVRMEFGFSGEDYLVIKVAKRRRLPVFIGGVFYVRDGNRSLPLNAEESAKYQEEHRPA